MSEIWKPASRYEGFYEVSTFGRVRSVAKDVWCGKGYRHRKGKILKPYITYGYPRVHLSKDGIKHNVMVHRLVAETFIPNPLNHPCINHKDENPMNPHVDNLEWCTYEYNSNYGTHRERMSKMFLNYPKYSLPVVRFTKDGVYVDEFCSISEAHRVTGINNIERCCKGLSRYSTAGGFKWKYKKDM